MTKANVFVLIKMSWRCVLKTKMKDVSKTSVCWEVTFPATSAVNRLAQNQFLQCEKFGILPLIHYSLASCFFMELIELIELI